MSIQLNEDQLAALDAVDVWLQGDLPFFVLSGAAGTGKTTTMRALADRIDGRVIFTAPTNKATKVLRQSLIAPDYEPETATIYAALGLVLDTSGEFKEITSAKAVDLSKYVAVIVDEASMVGSKLWPYIEMMSQVGARFIFLGDSAQLPPVKEAESQVFTREVDFNLTKVVRHDNNILQVAHHIRRAVDLPFAKLNFAQFAGNGVRITTSSRSFEEYILEQPETFRTDSKVVAWRNVTVAKYNKLIREALWGRFAQLPFVAGDRVMFAAPVTELEIKEGKRGAQHESRKVLIHTDEEGLVESVEERTHPDYDEIMCFRLVVTLESDEAPRNVVYVLHPKGKMAYNIHLKELEGAARMDRKNWKYFWQFKDKFADVRPAYAITAHRSQGSTYRRAFVDWQDILANPNRKEGIRCLYVACTRPSEELTLS